MHSSAKTVPRLFPQDTTGLSFAILLLSLSKFVRRNLWLVLCQGQGVYHHKCGDAELIASISITKPGDMLPFLSETTFQVQLPIPLETQQGVEEISRPNKMSHPKGIVFQVYLILYVFVGR